MVIIIDLWRIRGNPQTPFMVQGIGWVEAQELIFRGWRNKHKRLI